ncbi:CAP domain-containing protein [Tamlana fucoidanivorans]|uniref:CAP domain-containing protein n=1 Tax=Allotamlana fucoidanivorans TaxID=2583814 RepID=A0A5C4SD83_9FLAO|nr:CAP domain-containing protein [Tamlana fucoidanivorans]TNJ41523.1 CAP domain-containing protein [Tamlana fucoidanivorans]
MKLFRKMTLLVLVMSMTLFSCSTDSIEDEVDALELKLTAASTKSIEIEILNLINDYRLSKGLNPLSDMDIIKSVANSHTDYMVEKNTVSHDNFYVRSDYLKSNAGAQKVSENVAYGFSTAEGVVDAWIESEAHRINLEGDFTNFDISAEKNEDGRWYFTNIFISI